MTLKQTLPNRFQDLKVLGQGGAGTVYRAFDQKLGQPVAIKIPLLDEHGALAQTIAVELQATAALRHPNIVQVLDSGTLGAEQPYLVLEYAPKGSLDPWIERPMPWRHLEPLLEGILQGLGYAHTCGIVHRDIKTENILLSTDKDDELVAKIADLGMARVLQRKAVAQDAARAGGTMLYMPPEQFASDLASVHPTADFYAFGVLLYVLVTGHYPWEYTGIGSLLGQKTRGEYQALEPRPEQGVPPHVTEIVDRLLSTQAMDRYHLAADIRRDLRSGIRPSTGGDHGTGRPAATTLGVAAPELLALDAPEDDAPDDFPVTSSLAAVRMPRFVGRSRERATLWLRARESFAAPVGLSLTGATGVGRTRLASWLSNALERYGLTQTLWVRIEPNGGIFDAQCRALRNLLGLGTLRGAQLRERLASWCAAVNHGQDADVDLLLRGLDPDTSRGSADETADFGALWLSLFSRITRSLSRRGLAYVMVEDLSPKGGGEELATDLLRLAKAQPYPLLLAYEGRSATQGTGSAPADLEALEIGPMGEEELETLVHDLLPSHLVAPSFVGRLGGNPQVAVMAARLAAARHNQAEALDDDEATNYGEATDYDGSETLLTQSIAEAEAVFLSTMSIQDVAAERLDDYLRRMGEPSLGLGLLAATAHLPSPVLEEQALDAVRSATGCEPEAAEHALNEARLHGILMGDGAGHLQFSDPSLRAEALERPPVAGLHEACARILLAEEPVDPTHRLRAGRLLLAAGCQDESRHALVEAAENLLHFDLSQASAAFEDAFAVGETLGQSLEEPWQVRAVLGSALAARNSGDAAGAKTHLDRLAGTTLETHFEAELASLRASLHLMRGETPEALDAAAAARTHYQTLEDHRGEIRSFLLEGRARQQHRELEAAGEAFSRALEATRSLPEPAPTLLGRCLLSCGRNLRLRREPEQAALCFAEALDLANQVGDPSVKGVALRETASLDLMAGRTDEAEQRLREAVSCLDTAGLRGETANTRITLGELARARGELSTARREYSVALGVARAYGLSRMVWLAHTNLALAELGLGRLSRFRRRIAEIESLGAEKAPARYQPYFTAFRLILAASDQSWERGEECLELLQQDKASLTGDGDFLDLLDEAARAAQRGDELSLATDCWALALELAIEAEDTPRIKTLRKSLSGSS